MSHVPMNAPAQTSSFSSKEKNPNLELVPMGMHPAIIYGVINVGTQDGEYQGRVTASNKLKLVIEIPGHRQLYWKDDTVPSPSAMIMDFNYSVSKNRKSQKKTKLLLLIESLYGPLQESQYLTFDISQLAGLKVFVNVVHYDKLDGKIGAKVDSISQINPMYCDPNSLVLTNKILIYSVQMGFENMSFAQLPYFYRNLIKESHEGKAHIAAGGRFTMLNESGTIVIDDGSNNYTTAPLGKLVMTGNQYTYQQLKSAGWTDQAMIDNGYAKREAVQAIPLAPAPIQQPQYQAPAQQIPQANQMAQQYPPQAPMSIQPQMPLAHTNPTQPMLAMIDKTATYEDYIKAGWSDAQLIQSGKAMMMAPANNVFPTQQQAVQPPPVQAPSIPQAMPQPHIPQGVPQAQPVYGAIPPPQPSAAALFTQTPVAPIQQMGIPSAPQGPPMPPAPMSSFEQPNAMGMEPAPDDLPF